MVLAGWAITFVKRSIAAPKSQIANEDIAEENRESVHVPCVECFGMKMGEKSKPGRVESSGSGFISKLSAGRRVPGSINWDMNVVVGYSHGNGR